MTDQPSPYDPGAEPPTVKHYASAWRCGCGWINGHNLANCARCNRTVTEGQGHELFVPTESENNNLVKEWRNRATILGRQVKDFEAEAFKYHEALVIAERERDGLKIRVQNRDQIIQCRDELIAELQEQYRALAEDGKHWQQRAKIAEEKLREAFKPTGPAFIEAYLDKGNQ